MAAPKKGLSLYADLLASAGTISAAPIKYDVPKGGGDEPAAKKKNALQYQPKINRPKQPSSSASKHKFSSSTATVASLASSGQSQAPISRSNFQDWIGDDEEDFAYDRPKHVRGGKKNKKKKGQQTRTWDWDDIYDPTHPNRHQDYKGSEEQAREIRDWKARLYYHRLKETKDFGQNASTRSDEDTEKTMPPANKMFAPPANLNFAPPTSFEDDSSMPQRRDYDDDYYPPSVPNIPAHTTGDINDSPNVSTAPSQPKTTSCSVNQTPAADQDLAMKKAKAMAKIAEIKAKMHAQNAAKAENGAPASSTNPDGSNSSQPPIPDSESGVTISRAPVRYNVSAPQDQSDEDMQDISMSLPESGRAQSKHSRQNGFGQRILQKHGWEAGQGLGARGDGITTALVAKAEKRKKRADADGGGWAQPANMGKIVGGGKRKNDASGSGIEESEESKPSEVVKLVGMCANMDLDHEIASNNLFDEIGEDMKENYGQVERIFIWRKEQGGGDDVFVKFTSVLSAVRCVNGTKKEAITFGDNEVKAIFFDSQKFENGEYE
ncbi:MAG: hypothetical protein FE78DRAFT_31458 [Acidomyces sp. 'richmondensis']|nr:MAG: hypothetical protein FE78DRAFT_31458 [Acidomyces sp. 'richmondensis']